MWIVSLSSTTEKRGLRNVENADCLSSTTEKRGLRKSAARSAENSAKTRGQNAENADDRL